MEKHSPTVLLIGNDSDSVRFLKGTLEAEGYQIHMCSNGEEAEKKALEILPNLILLTDGMAGMNEFEVCSRLRRKIQLTNVPIIMISQNADAEYRERGYQSGIDDYISDLTYAKGLIRNYIERTKRYIQANPLTGLPGNIAVEYEIRNRIDEKETFGVAYIDIDQFKSYNDSYSWLAGDAVIRKTSQIIASATERYGGNNGFLGHLGGDDFIAVISVEDVHSFAQAIIHDFDSTIPSEYESVDQYRGYVLHRDRQGSLYCFPLLTISIAICTNLNMEFVHTGQIAQIGLEIKEYLKTLLGSHYLVDRRSTPEKITNPPLKQDQ